MLPRINRLPPFFLKGIKINNSSLYLIIERYLCSAKTVFQHDDKLEDEHVQFFEKRLNQMLKFRSETESNFNLKENTGIDFGSIGNSPVSNSVPLHESLIDVERKPSLTNNFLDEYEEIKGVDSHIRLKRQGKRPQTWYYRKTRDLISQNKITEAFNFVFEKMLERDKILPVRSIFHLLIDGSIKKCDSKTAFIIYKKMSDLKIQPNQLTYSRLFKVCAEEINKMNKIHKTQDISLLTSSESPSPHFLSREARIKEPLDRLVSLSNKLRFLRIPLSNISCNSLLMGLARAGDINGCLCAIDEWLQFGLAGRNTPFSLPEPPVFDELSKDPLPVSPNTQFRPDSFTLVACITALTNSTQIGSVRNKDLMLFLRLWHSLLPIMKGKLYVPVFTSLASLLGQSVDLRPMYKLKNSPITSIDIMKIPSSFKKINFKSDAMKLDKLISTDSNRKLFFNKTKNSLVLSGTNNSVLKVEDNKSLIVPKNLLINLEDFEIINIENAMSSNINLLKLENAQNITVILNSSNSIFIKIVLPKLPDYNVLLPWQKLSLFGGLEGFLSMVPFPKDANKDPAILKLFTRLISILPPFLEMEYKDNKNLDKFELKIVKKIRQLGLQPDLVIFNQFIYRRSLESADSSPILNLMNKAKIKPDLYTWSCLARGCRSKLDVENLFDKLKFSNLKPGIQLFTSLAVGCRGNYQALKFILEKMLDLKVSLDKRMIYQIESDIHTMKQWVDKTESLKNIDKKEKGKIVSFKDFITTYNKFLNSTQNQDL